MQAGYFQGRLVLCKTAVVTKACRQGGRPEAAEYNLFKYRLPAFPKDPGFGSGLTQQCPFFHEHNDARTG